MPAITPPLPSEGPPEGPASRPASRVECYSGGEYAERPRAFTWQGERLEIAAILGRWRQPDGKRFRVETRRGQVFDLQYVETTGEWSVQEGGS
jgi:hypothetical protein